ncbi:MAG: phosphoglucosamine mutase [Candidatus Muiribacteriota bacterium]
MEKKLFGTDGIRGVANIYPLQGDVLYKIAAVAGRILKKENKSDFVFLGKDTRLSCDMLEAAISAGLTSVGVHVYKLGIIPTPGLAYITKKKKALCGIMISASHNPFYDNGIKFIGSNGFKLSDKKELKIEKAFFDPEKNPEVITHKNIGRIYDKHNYTDEYIELIEEAAGNTDFGTLKVLIDCANGATSKCIPEIMDRLKINYDVIDNNPTGDNINNECGSTNLNKIASLVKKENYDCGIAFDGDGDRCLMVDDEGEVIDGDIMLSLAFLHKVKNDKSFNKKITGTVMANMGLKNLIKENQGVFIETKVGDKYVLEEMLRQNSSIGGEQSGHIIYLEKNTTGDGPLSAVEMLKIRIKENKPFSKIIKESGFKRFPQVMNNIKVKTKDKLWQISDLKPSMKLFEKEFGNKGRILIRPSGTEPLVRVMIEAEDLEKAAPHLNKITEIIEKELG